MNKNLRFTVVSLLVAFPLFMHAQVPVRTISFGVELGQLSTVQASYTPLKRLQVSAMIGPVVQVKDDVDPHHVGLAAKYFFSDEQSSGFIGLMAFGSNSYGGVAIPVGMQQFVSKSIAFWAQLSPAMSGERKMSAVLIAGFGVTFYMQ